MHPFLRVLRLPGVPRLVPFWLITFLPFGMAPLGVVFLLRDNGYSYVTAGVVLATYTTGMAAGAPVVGRLIDRAGQRDVLMLCAVAFAAGLLGLVGLAARGTSPSALCVAAGITGAAIPRTGSAMRALWPSLTRSTSLRDVAYTMDVTLIEVAPVVGALMVFVLVRRASPPAALATAALMGLIGTIGFVTAPAARNRPTPTTDRRGASVLAAPGVRALLLAGAGFGGVGGAIDVAAPSFAEAHGAAPAAGLALAACALGSILGGLGFASRFDAVPLWLRYRVALLLLVLGFAFPLLARSNVDLVLLFFVAGIPVPIANGAACALLSTLVPSEARTEGFGWLSSAMIIGGSLGSVTAGAVADQAGGRAAVGTATGFAFLALAAASIRPLPQPTDEHPSPTDAPAARPPSAGQRAS